jgi:hypothetical protein
MNAEQLHNLLVDTLPDYIKLADMLRRWNDVFDTPEKGVTYEVMYRLAKDMGEFADALKEGVLTNIREIESDPEDSEEDE